MTPLVPGGRKLIGGYGDGGFRIDGQRYEGSVLVFPEQVIAWPPRGVAEVDAGALTLITDMRRPTDILLLGCGESFVDEPPGLRAALRNAGVILEWMDTGAACRTFNVLLAEERRVAAALIAV